jgi:putative DNA-invertase from lambdoid prophage Rac
MIGVYVRVSTDEQSVGEQIRQGKAYADSLAESFQVYRDDDVSSKITLLNRKGGGKLAADMVKGEIRVVWVQRIDRLNRNLMAALVFWGIMKEHNINIVSNYEGVFEPNDGDKYFVYCLNSLLAEREGMILVKRTNDGLARARREGKKIGGGKKGRRWKR